MSMDLFKTRAKANEGKRLPLLTPDGKETEHWLQVRHVWSDAFVLANDAEMSKAQDAVLAAGDDKAAVAAIKREAELRLWAALVADWSFEDECTPDAVMDFLREAPQIGKAIDKFAADSRSFFKEGSTS